MELIFMLFSPFSCHFLSLRSKYSFQQFVLKNSQFVLLLERCSL